MAELPFSTDFRTARMELVLRVQFVINNAWTMEACEFYGVLVLSVPKSQALLLCSGTSIWIVTYFLSSSCPGSKRHRSDCEEEHHLEDQSSHSRSTVHCSMTLIHQQQLKLRESQQSHTSTHWQSAEWNQPALYKSAYSLPTLKFSARVIYNFVSVVLNV